MPILASEALLRENKKSSDKILPTVGIAVADPWFPRGEGANSPGGMPTYNFAKISQNCMNLKDLEPPGGHASLVPPSP